MLMSNMGQTMNRRQTMLPDEEWDAEEAKY
jgi:hypothetical protein